MYEKLGGPHRPEISWSEPWHRSSRALKVTYSYLRSEPVSGLRLDVKNSPSKSETTPAQIIMHLISYILLLALSLTAWAEMGIEDLFNVNFASMYNLRF